MSKNIHEADAARKPLVATINLVTDLEWEKVTLDGGATIEVSYPYLTNDLLVPFTAREQWDLAVKLKVFPLTRAVADQVHMEADKGNLSMTYRWWPTIWDFEGFSANTRSHTIVYSSYGWQLVSGYCKLWLISMGPYGAPKQQAVNYGFFTKQKNKTKGDGLGYAGGKFLKGWYVVQSLGTAHDKAHWDYSQLLMFMKKYSGGDIRTALLNGDPVLWDEPGKLDAARLPF